MSLNFLSVCQIKEHFHTLNRLRLLVAENIYDFYICGETTVSRDKIVAADLCNNLK